MRLWQARLIAKHLGLTGWKKALYAKRLKDKYDNLERSAGSPKARSGGKK